MASTIRRTAVVTGGSTGIGAIYADRLPRRGYDLLLVARDQSQLDTTADRIRDATGNIVETLAVDLTNRDDVIALGERIAADETVTLLVNNAGTPIEGPLLEADADEIAAMIAVNVTALTLLSVSAGNAFSGRSNAAIVNISSVLALAPEMFEGSYGASKSYVFFLSLHLARQLADKVHVQVVVPGPTRTAFWEKSGAGLDGLAEGAVMAAEDLVDAALAGLDRGETVTIPALGDIGLWNAFEEARRALVPNLSRQQAADRYR